MEFIALLHRTKRYVILSGVRSTESKNLRIIDAFQQIFGAKILRLASLAQDDRLVRLHDKLKFEFLRIEIYAYYILLFPK